MILQNCITCVYSVLTLIEDCRIYFEQILLLHEPVRSWMDNLVPPRILHCHALCQPSAHLSPYTTGLEPKQLELWFPRNWYYKGQLGGPWYIVCYEKQCTKIEISIGRKWFRNNTTGWKPRVDQFWRQRKSADIPTNRVFRNECGGAACDRISKDWDKYWDEKYSEKEWRMNRRGRCTSRTLDQFRLSAFRVSSSHIQICERVLIVRSLSSAYIGVHPRFSSCYILSFSIAYLHPHSPGTFPYYP